MLVYVATRANINVERPTINTLNTEEDICIDSEVRCDGDHPRCGILSRRWVT